MFPLIQTIVFTMAELFSKKQISALQLNMTLILLFIPASIGSQLDAKDIAEFIQGVIDSLVFDVG